MHPFYVQFNASWRIFIWVDDNKMFVVGGLTPCSTLVLFASSKKLPIEKNWSHGSYLTPMFGWRDFSMAGFNCHPGNVAMFPNSSETIPYHPCMDDLLTYKQGGKWATFVRGNGLVNIFIPSGIILENAKLGPYRLFGGPNKGWVEAVMRRFASKKSSRIWTYTSVPSSVTWLAGKSRFILIGRFIFKRLGFPASHVCELGGCIWSDYSDLARPHPKM